MSTTNHYRENYIPEANISSGGVTGCYFNGSAYLFYHHEVRDPDTHLHIEYVKFTNVQKKGDSVEVLASDQDACQVLFKVISGIATCVHDGVLYVFCLIEGSIFFTRTTDGRTWSKLKQIDDFRLSSNIQIAAVSAGNKLYVIGSRENEHLQGKRMLVVAHSADGERWYKEYIQSNWENPMNISACSYMDSSGSMCLMVGGVSTNGQVRTMRYKCESTTFSFIGYDDHIDIKTDLISLVAGSTEGDDKGHMIQMFVNGEHGATWIGWKHNKKKEYHIQKGTWGTPKERTKGYTRYPTWAHMGAFPYFTSSDNNEIQQEIWFVMKYTNSLSINYLYIARWKSDYLKLINKEVQPVSDAFRALIGVVEGPPPYILNGKDFTKNVSMFEFGRSQSQQVSVTSTFKVGAYLRIGGKFGETTKGLFEMKIALEQAVKHQQTTEHRLTDSKMIYPLFNKSQATYIYLRPVVTKWTYQLLDWSGQKIEGIYSYLFGTSAISLDYELKNTLSSFPGSPDTNNFASWYQRFPSLPEYADPSKDKFMDMPVTWVENGSTSWSFEEKTSEMETRTTTVTAEVKAGIDNIFDIGGNTSFTYEMAHKAEFGSKVGFKLDYPSARPDHPEDITKVVIRTFLFNPREGYIDSCYWIPKEAKGQRPWCIAWSVHSYKTQSETKKKAQQKEK